MNDTTAINVVLAADLHKRAVQVRKRLHTSTTQLIRDALAERVEFFEAKFRAEDEAKQQKKDTTGRTLRTLSDASSRTSSLAPSAPTPMEQKLDEKVEERAVITDSPLQAIYGEHARKIFEVLDQPYERSIRARAAIAAIKKAAPLTHPLDADILRALEQEVLKLRAMQPVAPPVMMQPAPALLTVAGPETFGDRVTRFMHDLMGKSVDTNNIRTSGDAEEK